MTQESLAERLAIQYLKELDPTLKFMRKPMELEYAGMSKGEVNLCADIEGVHPVIASALLVRDAIWMQRVREQRPSFEVITWNELCQSLKDSAFAALALIYRDEYMKDEYTGSGLRTVDGKMSFVLRPATEEGKQKNIEAREQIKAIQALWDTARGMMGLLKSKAGKTSGGETLH